jgi:hypothetical protein
MVETARGMDAAGILGRPTCDTIAMRNGDEFYDREEVFGLSAAGAAPSVRRAVRAGRMRPDAGTTAASGNGNVR